MNSNTYGSQHSSFVSILNDDTAIVIYLDGDPRIKATLKGVIMNKNLKKIGDEFEIASFVE